MVLRPDRDLLLGSTRRRVDGEQHAVLRPTQCPEQTAGQDRRGSRARTAPQHADAGRTRAHADRLEAGLARNVDHGPLDDLAAVDVPMRADRGRSELAADVTQVRLVQLVGGLRLARLEDGVV